MTHTIRRAVPADRDALLSVARRSGLFEPEELAFMAAELDAWAGGGTDRVWLIAGGWGETGRAEGAAMLAPEPMSRAAWNTLFVAVASEARRVGIGRALVAAAEAAARDQGGRLMLIDTASAEAFAPARALYAASGYAREAVVRDFHADGVDRATCARRL